MGEAAAGEVAGSSALPSTIEEAEVETQRAIVSHPISEIIIMDWLGRQVVRGEIYFCDDSRVTQASLAEGHVANPGFPWTHALVAAQNHAPLLMGRESVTPSGATGILRMPDPTFVAQVQAENFPAAEIKLVVDYPWVDREGWPTPLLEEFQIPDALALRMDPATETTFFVGAPGMSTTVACRNKVSIVTPEGLSKAVEYSPQSTERKVVLRRYPFLTVGTRSAANSTLETPCRVSITLKESGMHDHETSKLVDADRYSEWGLPYDPAYSSAYVVVRGEKSGVQLGQAEVQLTGSDQLEVIELRQEIHTISVLDMQGFAVPGVVIVQAGATLATTDSAGTAQVALNKEAGTVWFLSRPHDALSALPDQLLAEPIVYLHAASGIAIQCPSADQASMVANTGRFEAQGLTFSAALWEAPNQSCQVYGFEIVSGSTYSMDFGGGITVSGDRFTFRLKPSASHPLQLSLAGIFEVQEETQADLLCSDGFEQEAWRESVQVIPHEIRFLDFLPEGVFETISFRVIDAKGNPLEGAAVSTGPWAGLDPIIPTGPDGSATLLVSGEAETVLLVESEGFVSRRVPWPFPAGEDVLRLEKSRPLRIQLLDPSGNRVEAGLVLRDGDSKWHGGSPSTGVFQFTGVPIGTLVAQVTQGGSVQEYAVPPVVEMHSITL